MKGIERAAAFLREYDGPSVNIMEVCGTHTAAIFKSGIRSILSPKIRLISGPGCPVCVTPAGYIDKLLEYAMTPGCCVLSFGDMLKVPGSAGSLAGRRGEGAEFQMMYSPLQALELAEKNPAITYIVAAVGFETTAPAYALLLGEAERRGLSNIRLLTALKTILPAMETLCATEPNIDAFLCPGHVSTIIGADAYKELCGKYHKPMCVAGFDGGHLLAAIHEIMTQLSQGRAEVRNLYAEAVSGEGNKKAQALLDECFASGEAVWRGIGDIPGSGLYLRDKYARFDAGSRGLSGVAAEPPGCRCADVICGRTGPNACPHFGRKCTPLDPLGACMVSDEGACSIWFRNVGSAG
jgi:hydrogenase expression/formation protein HypD